jgi:hypothetical protein
MTPWCSMPFALCSESCLTGAGVDGYLAFGMRAGVAELVDAGDLKSLVRKDVRVQVPSSVPGCSFSYSSECSRGDGPDSKCKCDSRS